MTRSVHKLGAELLSAMANEKRLQILVLLMEREVAVGEIAGFMGLTQSAVSQHLKILRMAGLITSRRVSQNVYYSGTAQWVRQILEIISTIEVSPKPDATDSNGALGSGTP